MSALLEALHTRVLVGDGAMGTQLQQAGLEPGGCGEAWNLDHPERVLAIQRPWSMVPPTGNSIRTHGTADHTRWKTAIISHVCLLIIFRTGTDERFCSIPNCANSLKL